ncbi:glycosyltransferase family 2 protein [Bifidobacterium leontopitheci]|uniref:Glycosyl transferase n=1 Tax=Bifidobacterium leontopitheci TaxID=2650774 RepID=A0A6I1GL47_9BIFI|nr:glycosyltransferase family 2 protein [Bifidobacterium leontopitheci]KAB7790326.1 glycosyl transferase [Bifidobacterium leontopitheci]
MTAISATEPLVSVIVPVYNAEQYLRHCVDSILAQSHRNLEVILVDDGATDSSPAICDEYAAADPRVTVIHQTNGGISKAQNAGLDAAHGEFIAFSDNDDILDRRNIELLLHALLATGADMSKARWRQFGVSQIDEVVAEAAQGADEPESVTVFRNPLAAYQTVFCKSLRLLGSALGRRTETRYFNEANWCRLYRRELWDGLRFPLGRYAQDITMAGKLYSRMTKVVDVNRILYFWLQEPDSVTHSKRTAAFWHDNALAAAENFALAMQHGVNPYRSYFELVNSVREEDKMLRGTADAEDHDQDMDNLHHDAARMHELLATLSPQQKMRCATMSRIRSCENIVYDRKIHGMK